MTDDILRLARAVYPVAGEYWFEYMGHIYWQPAGDFDADDAVKFDPANNADQFCDVLAWLLTIPGASVNGGIVWSRGDLTGVTHDGTASGIRAAVVESARRVVK